MFTPASMTRPPRRVNNGGSHVGGAIGEGVRCKDLKPVRLAENAGGGLIRMSDWTL
jgi:hypothetical protein